MVAIMEHAADLLTQVHLTDCFDHTASSGLRYTSSTRPATRCGCTSTSTPVRGEVDYGTFFATPGQARPR